MRYAVKPKYKDLLDDLANDRITNPDETHERLAKEFLSRLNSDGEPLRNKGAALIEAGDDLLIPLCGWSLRSLLALAGLIEDEEGVCIE